MKQLTIILLLIPLFSISQNINGKIYDEDSTVKGALIINLTQNDTTYSDLKGSFKLQATINDSLVFYSLFHHTKKIKVKGLHFNEVVVFQLKKRVNELGEVLLTDEKEKPFNEVEYTSDIGLAIANDIKNNPHLYTPIGSYNNGIDFIKLAKLIGINKLFKKRKKNTVKTISYKQIDSLFSNSKMFTDTLLINELKIKKDYKHLFFEYCESQGLNGELLHIKENLVLLDSVFKLGNRFLDFIKEKN